MKLKIEKAIYEGWGIGHAESGKTIFVKKSLPGDILDVEIIKEKKNMAEATIKSINTPSPIRIEAKCPHFDRCGGCDYQNTSYKNQLDLKSAIFKETLVRAKIKTNILPIIPGSDKEFGYRNTNRFFFKEFDVKFAAAMRSYKDFRNFIKINYCLLQSEKCNLILDKMVELINKSSNPKNFLEIRLREGKRTGDIMVELITNDDQIDIKDQIIDELKKLEVKSFFQTIQGSNRHKLLSGSPVIFEHIGRFTFQISLDSFFQTNGEGVVTLYNKVKEFAQVGISDTILDLYCGTGTIGIYLSTLAKKILGIDITQSAINDATGNAKLNKLSNCEFICSDVNRIFSNPIIHNTKYNILILDPPRTGLTPSVIEKIAKLTTNRLVYVSCNPATFARDIKEFEKYKIKLEKVQPVDMFPQTHHIECVGVLHNQKS